MDDRPSHEEQGARPSLEAEIIVVLEATNVLKESPDWEPHQLVECEPEIFDRVVEKRIAGINAEVTELKTQAEKLEREIAELGGDGVKP